MPVDWVKTAEENALVYSPPRRSSDYYATITLQAVASVRQPLGGLLQDTYAAIASYPSFAWNRIVARTIAGWPALEYEAQFEFLELPRRKIGVMLDNRDVVIDLSYCAPEELFRRFQQVFEGVVMSLEVTPPEELPVAQIPSEGSPR